MHRLFSWAGVLIRLCVRVLDGMMLVTMAFWCYSPKKGSLAEVEADNAPVYRTFRSRTSEASW